MKQVELSAEAMLQQLSGALRTTEDDEAESLVTIRQTFEDHYQRREIQMRENFKQEMSQQVAHLQVGNKSNSPSHKSSYAQQEM